MSLSLPLCVPLCGNYTHTKLRVQYVSEMRSHDGYGQKFVIFA